MASIGVKILTKKDTNLFEIKGKPLKVSFIFILREIRIVPAQCVANRSKTDYAEH